MTESSASPPVHVALRTGRPAFGAPRSRMPALLALSLLVGACSSAVRSNGDAGAGAALPSTDASGGAVADAEEPGDVEASDASSEVEAGTSSTQDGGPLSLLGLTVTMSVHCCAAPVDDTNAISQEVVATVGPQIEFPAISSLSNGTRGVIDADVDVGPSDLKISYRGAFTTAGGSFNGYLFRFSNNGSGPHVASATLGPETNTPAGAVTITLDSAGGVLIDVAGIRGTATTIVSVIFGLAVPVPPPASDAAPFGGAGGIRG